jgi:dolichol-phosphate mannosyltransferase
MPIDYERPDPSQAGRSVVIIPTYNEAQNILLVLQRVLAQEGEIDVIVVDDGSPDGTADQVRKFSEGVPGRIHLIERSGKLGLGSAYIAGF